MPGNPEAEAARGFLVAAPGSGAGKTTLVLGLLRAFRNAGLAVASAKSGPDYIDPKFHAAAGGQACINLDAWAMDPATVRRLAHDQGRGHDLLVVEGAMGLFDGAANGTGSAAALAGILSLPVILTVDCARQAQSVAALVHGFQSFDRTVDLAGVVLNRVGSERHEKMLRAALEPLPVRVLGALPRSDALILPERHLGLVQAGEHPDLETFLETAAALCARHMDLDALADLAGGMALPGSSGPALPVPPAQKVAIASDIAFAFAYPHLLDFWRREGAELSFFSPLADEAPRNDCDAVFLPGGYPELHAPVLSAARTFRAGMQAAANAGKLIYGECGGFMALGTGLIDAGGARHDMLGLLPLETSFQTRRRHLGYRRLRSLGGLPWTGPLAAHEFHYASIVSEGAADRLFAAEDAEGNVLADMGLRWGPVAGSFAHVISRAAGQPVG